jgi:hypothetical protein
MVFGTMVALGERAQEGRSWLVRISLAQVGKWILDLGEVAPAALQAISAEFTRELALWSMGEQNAIWAITVPQTHRSTLRNIGAMDKTKRAARLSKPEWPPR